MIPQRTGGPRPARLIPVKAPRSAASRATTHRAGNRPQFGILSATHDSPFRPNSFFRKRGRLFGGAESQGGASRARVEFLDRRPRNSMPQAPAGRSPRAAARMRPLTGAYNAGRPAFGKTSLSVAATTLTITKTGAVRRLARNRLHSRPLLVPDHPQPQKPSQPKRESTPLPAQLQRLFSTCEEGRTRSIPQLIPWPPGRGHVPAQLRLPPDLGSIAAIGNGEQIRRHFLALLSEFRRSLLLIEDRQRWAGQSRSISRLVRCFLQRDRHSPFILFVHAKCLTDRLTARFVLGGRLQALTRDYTFHAFEQPVSLSFSHIGAGRLRIMPEQFFWSSPPGLQAPDAQLVKIIEYREKRFGLEGGGSVRTS